MIASENGELMSFSLSEVRSIKLIDEGTKRDVNEFANATRQLAGETQRPSCHFDGAGAREMLGSYPSRRPFGRQRTGRPRFARQTFLSGWAIVDNVSGEIGTMFPFRFLGFTGFFHSAPQKPFTGSTPWYAGRSETCTADV